MIGRARAFGAVTVVNAMATGRGAAIGVDLKTEVEVHLVEEKVVEAEIYVRGMRENCDLSLVSAVKELIFEKFDVEGGMKAVVESDIPIGRGLKSSSAAANALVKALLKALGEEVSDMEIVKLGVEAARRAGVTITGAFDDACASMFGGLCVTDNFEMKLFKREVVEDLYVVIYVPKFKVLTSSMKSMDFKRVKPYAEQAFGLALQGDWRRAMKLNGFAYAVLFGYDLKPLLDALEAGAEAVGLSGKGPAIAALTRDPDAVADRWSAYEVDVLVTRVRN